MMREMILNSGTIFKYEETKGSSNEAVLFIHGLKQTSFCFRELIRKLSIYCSYETTFVNINLTGFGKSNNPNVKQGNMDVDLPSLTILDLDEFFFRYNTDNPALKWKVVSFSIGTYLSLCWLLGTNRKNIECIVLTSPFGIFSNVSSYGFFLYYIFKYKLVYKFYSWLNYFYKYFSFISSPYNFSFDIAANLIDKNENGTYISRPLLSYLKDFRIPIHLIYGSNDCLCPYEQGNILQFLYPKIVEKCFVLRHSGHVPLYDDEYYQVIKKILYPDIIEYNSLNQIIYSHMNIWRTEYEIRENYLLY